MQSPTPARRRFSASAPFVSAVSLLLVAVLGLAAPASAQGTLDQLQVRTRRGDITTVSGSIKQYDLTKIVVVDGAGKETTYDAEAVRQVTAWGDAPASFHEGVKSLEADAFEAAVGALRKAAGEAQREVVKAAARAKAAEALYRWGATDPTRFTEAGAECTAFVASFANNRDLPRVLDLQARCTWLAGKPAEAAAQFKAIHAKLSGDKPADGFDRTYCLRAGLDAARAFLDGKDTLGAREMFTALEAKLGPLVAGLAADDTSRAALQAILDEAALGAGYVDLAANQTKQALAFFQGKVTGLNANSTMSARNATLLGHGEALLAEGRYREAALALSKVAALDAADRDRAGRALVKLAEAYSKLSDADGRVQACSRVKDALQRFATTPASVRARQLAKELGC
jgi:TolA-binding protein